MIYEEAAINKFKAQRRFFPNSKMFNSLRELKNDNIQEGTFCLVLDTLCEEIHLEDFFLVECISYFSEAYKLVVIKRKGSKVNVAFPKEAMRPVNSISLSLLCTEDKLYLDFLHRAVDWYTNSFKNLVPLEVCLAYYGDNPPYNVDKVVVSPYSNFSMASGRNKSQLLCSSDYILTMDLDCYLSKHQLESLIEHINKKKTHGLIHIRPMNYRVSSGGRYLGTREVLQSNLYDERFRFCWAEDTEYLMNFSRNGIIPDAQNIDFLRVDHPRTKTSSSKKDSGFNKELYYKIVKNGR